MTGVPRRVKPCQYRTHPGRLALLLHATVTSLFGRALLRSAARQTLLKLPYEASTARRQSAHAVGRTADHSRSVDTRMGVAVSRTRARCRDAGSDKDASVRACGTRRTRWHRRSPRRTTARSGAAATTALRDTHAIRRCLCSCRVGNFHDVRTLPATNPPWPQLSTRGLVWLSLVISCCSQQRGSQLHSAHLVV